MERPVRSFDESDPDALQALRDAVPIVAQLADARAKPTPRNPHTVQAHRAHIINLEGLLKLKAERAGCSATELERLAFAELRRARQRRGLPAPSSVVRFKPVEPRKKSEEERLAETEIMNLRDEVAHAEQLIAKHQQRLGRLRADLGRREVMLAEMRRGGGAR